MLRSAWNICLSYAYLKGFRNRKGELDTYRAANSILRDALDGKSESLQFVLFLKISMISFVILTIISVSCYIVP